MELNQETRLTHKRTFIDFLDDEVSLASLCSFPALLAYMPHVIAFCIVSFIERLEIDAAQSRLSCISEWYRS
jgi:hypothetical protein